MEERVYKYKIDKQILDDFCLADVVTDTHIREVDKVITAVLMKHFSNYVNNEDLRQTALLAVLENRSKYDPSFSAYNFVYTGVRNAIGNRLKKASHEVLTDDYAVFDTRTISDDGGDTLPAEVSKFAPYLLGQHLFDKVKIPINDVVPLMVFLKYHQPNVKVRQIPDFVSDNDNAVALLYSLLREVISNK